MCRSLVRPPRWPAQKDRFLWADKSEPEKAMMMEPPDFPEASPDPRAERPQLWVKRSTQSRIKETETQKATEPRGRVDAMGFGRIEAELDANGAAEKTTVDPEIQVLGVEQAEEQKLISHGRGLKRFQALPPCQHQNRWSVTSVNLPHYTATGWKVINLKATYGQMSVQLLIQKNSPCKITGDWQSFKSMSEPKLQVNRKPIEHPIFPQKLSSYHLAVSM